MAEGRRPGGLTALAVLNFVFSGLGALISLFLLLAMALRDTMPARDAAKLPSDSVILLLGLLGLVSGGLLIAAGVGYLKQKHVLGRVLGNAYAATSLAHTALGIALGREGFSMFTLIFFIYPLLTLFLVNATFKDDLVN